MTKSALMKHALAACCLLGVAVAVACSSSTPTGLNCGDGAQDCNGSCVTVARDPQNCGACGKSCQMGEVCSQGSCAGACGGGTTKCGSECVDTKSDPRNCGACSKACQSNEVCMAGACAASCGMGTMKCGMACVNAMTDPTNCGGCGTMCKAGETCSGGKCSISCQQGLTKCNASMIDAGAPDGGDGGPQFTGDFCANLQSDNNNCGGCGNACPQDKPVCTNGQCALPLNCANKTCDQGTDPKNNALTWVVCNATCTNAWVSMLSVGGGQYHAEYICKQLGYNKIGQHGGTCGKVCGYCGNLTYTCSSNGPETFDNGGTSCGSDNLGQILCSTVMWECVL